jgi:hypothetical protein
MHVPQVLFRTRQFYVRPVTTHVHCDASTHHIYILLAGNMYTLKAAALEVVSHVGRR